MLEGPPAVSPGATWPTGVPATGMQVRKLFTPSELSTTSVSRMNTSQFPHNCSIPCRFQDCHGLSYTWGM